MENRFCLFFQENYIFAESLDFLCCYKLHLVFSTDVVQDSFKGKANPEQAKDLTKFYKPRNSQATENIQARVSRPQPSAAIPRNAQRSLYTLEKTRRQLPVPGCSLPC